MPFIIPAFVAKLQTKLDPESPLFTSGTEGDTMEPIAIPNQLVSPPPPIPPLQWATVWGEATELGAAGLVPPSSTLAAAKMAMIGSLLSVTSATPPHMGLKTGFMAFAAAYIPGALPIAALTPPPGPGPAFESIDGMGMNSPTNLPWLMGCGNIVNSWFMQGQAFYLPNGPMLMWM